MEAQQSSLPERKAPDREELAEASGAVEVNDACRRVRPLVRMTGRTADADARGDDDREPVRKQLEVHALRRDAGNGARSVHRGPRLIQRARADRRRYQHLIEAIALVGLLAGCGGGSGSGAPAITVGAARSYALSGFEPAGPVTAGKPTRVSFTILQPDGKPLTAVQARPRPAHRRAPDHRPARSLDDRARASARRRERAHQHHDHVPRARPVPRRHRRLPADGGAGTELPGVRGDPRRGRVQRRSRCRRSRRARPSTATRSRCTGRRSCARSSRRSSTSR